jgi:hypothetical protein
MIWNERGEGAANEFRLVVWCNWELIIYGVVGRLWVTTGSASITGNIEANSARFTLLVANVRLDPAFKSRKVQEKTSLYVSSRQKESFVEDRKPANCSESIYLLLAL